MKPNFKLEELKRENVYQVPEQYFDQLPNRIMLRVTAGQERPETVWGALPAKLRLALAGTSFAAVFATVFLLNFSDTTTEQYQMANLSRTEVLDYLLTSDQLDRTDLAILNAADQDLTAQFIGANATEIRQELEDRQYEDLYL